MEGPNRKTLKLQKKVEEAFVSLVNENDLDDLSVASLCKKAKISRSAFYTHYRGVHDVMASIVASCFAFADRFTEPASMAYFPLFRSIFTCFARRQAFLLGVSKDHNRVMFEKQLRICLEPVLTKSLLFYRGNWLSIPLPFAIETLSCAFFGLLMEYVEDGFQKTPAQLASYYTLIFEQK